MLKNAILTAAGLLVIGVARLGFNSVALHAFGDAIAGQLSVALSLAVLVSLPASTAFGPTAVRFIAAARARGQPGVVGALYRWLLAATLLLGALLALGLWPFADALAASRNIPLGLVLQALGLSIAYALYLYLRNVFYALDRVGAYTWLELVAGVAFFCALGALAWAGLWHLLLLAFVVGYGAFSVGALWATRRPLGDTSGAAGRPRVAELSSFAALALVGTVASLCVRELAVVLAPEVSDLADTAHLALAMSLLLPLQFLPRMLRTVIFARSAELDGAGRRDLLARSVSEASHWLLVTSWPASVLLVLLGEPLLVVAGGAPTPERLLAFALLAAAALAEVLALPAVNGLSGVGLVRVPTLAALLALVPTALVWWLARDLGIVGLAAGMLAGTLVKSGLPMVVAARQLDARLTRAPRLLAAYVLLSAMTLAALAAGGSPWLLAPAYALVVALAARAELAALWRALARVRPRVAGAAEPT